MSSARLLNFCLDRELAPDWLIRIGIRQLLRARLREQRAAGAAGQEAFIAQLRKEPVAPVPDSANSQHYEVPAGFFRLLLGPHLKYSCGLWPDGAATDLSGSEIAMLELTIERARLSDGQDVLELGCGWGSLSLFMAARFPASRILAVSNSRSQREFIEAEAVRRGLRNLRVVTADMNDFAPDGPFDRVVSVEMFEHMRNYQELLRRIACWLRPDGALFVHIFSHREFCYPFETRGAGDWMARHFFSGGLMPSDSLFGRFDAHMTVREQWTVNGRHYWRTSEAWLEQLDRRQDEVLALFQETYGATAAPGHLARWRVFLLACAELFRFQGGEEWHVSHYLLEKTECVQENEPGGAGRHI